MVGEDIRSWLLRGIIPEEGHMNNSGIKSRSDTESSSPRHSILGAWVVVGVLSAFLVGAGIVGYLGWTSTDSDVPASGYIAMALGVIFSLVVGVGLMALVFYSSRKGYDEPPVLIQEPFQRDELQSNREENAM
jgi:hypothetical protein